MKVIQRIALCVMLVASMFVGGSAQNREIKQAYVQKYSGICISEMQRTAIPASIKMAQAMLESSYGMSELAQKSNNHFGIKCSSGWSGKTYYVIDDEIDENFEKKQSCFRAYEKSEESFIAHSDFLIDPKKEKRYGFLFSFGSRDYRSWAHGLRQAGYATNPNYGDLLIRVIEDNELYKLDNAAETAGGPVTTNPASIKDRTIERVNDVKMILAFEGETISELAAKYDVSPDKIVEYNENHYRGGERLKSGTRIYLQKKRRFFRGRQADHFIKSRETMFDISQLYGVRLYRLYEKNKIPVGSVPVEGSKISIRGFVSDKNIPKILANYQSDEVSPEKLKSKSFYDDDAPGFPNALNGGPLDFEITGVKEKKVISNIPSEIPAKEVKPAATPIPAPTTETKRDTAKNIPNTPVDVAKQPTVVPTEPKIAPTVKPTPTINDPKSEVKKEKLPEKNPPIAAEQFHIVVKGDTAYNIAKRYNITIDQLKKLNMLNDLNIKLGQKLRVK